MDINGFYAPSTASVYVSPVAGELTKVLKATPGLLHYLMAANTTGAVIFIFVFDSTGAAAGNLVMPPIPIPANGLVVVPLAFAMPGSVNGLVVSASTTQAAYAAAGANAMQIAAIFK